MYNPDQPVFEEQPESNIEIAYGIKEAARKRGHRRRCGAWQPARARPVRIGAAAPRRPHRRGGRA